MRRYALVFGFLFCAVIAALVAPVHAQDEPADQHRDQQADSRSNAQKEGGVSLWIRTLDDPTAFFTASVAAFTLILAASTIGLWFVTWRTAVRQARDTEITERAYISAWARGIEASHVDRGDRVHALVVLRNTGHLPARNVSWQIHMGNFEGLEPPEVTVKPMKNVLAPGGEIFTSSDVMFTERTPNSTMIWGKVTYDDGFGVGRYTKFCHWYRTKDYVGVGGIFEKPGSEARTWYYGNDAT